MSDKSDQNQEKITVTLGGAFFLAAWCLADKVADFKNRHFTQEGRAQRAAEKRFANTFFDAILPRLSGETARVAHEAMRLGAKPALFAKALKELETAIIVDARCDSLTNCTCTDCPIPFLTISVDGKSHDRS